MPDIHPLRAYRVRHELSQQELGKLIGVDRVTINRWEKRRRHIAYRLLPKITKVTGIKPAKLLFDAD